MLKVIIVVVIEHQEMLVKENNAFKGVYVKLVGICVLGAGRSLNVPLLKRLIYRFFFKGDFSSVSIDGTNKRRFGQTGQLNNFTISFVPVKN